MSGLGLVLSIAKDAMAAQQYGVNVTAHNIANVSTDGYSRQTSVNEAKEPAPYAGLLLGRGVDTTQVLRTTDQFIEKQLRERKSDMLTSQELENYMQVLEGMFNENSESSISTMLSEFWNLWHDIANNPSGSPERIALYEHSILMSDQFDTLNTDLTQLQTDLTNAMNAGINEINQITSELAQVNSQLVGMETGISIANDLRDKRNTLTSELGQYIDVKGFEQSNGSLSIITAKGCVLVHGNDSYDIVLGGDNGDRVMWKSDSGVVAGDITDYITMGKLGGWLEMRDEIIEKYKLDLNAMAEEFIWTVNQQHSQGVGLELFDAAVTGTYKTGSSGLLETLTYGNKIDYTKDFRMWIDDGTSQKAVTVDMGKSTAGVTNWAVAGTFTDGSATYTITVTTGGNVSDGTTEVKWRSGTEAWTTGVAVAVNGDCVIDGNTIKFDANETLVAGNTLTINTKVDKTADKLIMTPSGTANSVSDTYTFTVTSGGEIATNPLTIAWSNSTTSDSFTLDAAASPTATVDGMTLEFTSGSLFKDDVFTITTNANGKPTANLPSAWHWTLESFKDEFNTQVENVFGAGNNYVDASVTSENALKFSPDAGCSFGFGDHNFDDNGLLAALGINTFFEGYSAGGIGVNSKIGSDKNFIAAAQIDSAGSYATGDNTNALAIADLQYTSTDIGLWTCDRIDGDTEGGVTATIDDYYHSMISSIGIKSSSISRGRAFNAVMANKIEEIRDSISGVSLDEEMTNLIKFQTAFQAAAKLISVSDEMLNTLLSIK